MLPTTVLIFGLGDLAQRLALILAEEARFKIALAGRDELRGQCFASLVSACSRSEVKFLKVDLASPDDTANAIRFIEPDLVVHCAVSVSPWLVAAQDTVTAAVLRKIGFGAQLPFQVRLAKNLMRAVRKARFRGPVINCSYPDLVNGVLNRVGLAPTTGIGNVGMIWAKIQSLSGSEGGQGAVVRVLGQHVHTVSSLTCDAELIPAELRPMVFLGDATVTRRDELVYAGAPIRWSKETNALSASNAALIVRALALGGGPLRTSVPGPLGLIGGYPVTIEGGCMHLDLPPDISLSEASEFNAKCARIEGIEEIDEDGTIFLTERANSMLFDIHPALCSPIQLSGLEAWEACIKHTIRFEDR